MVNDRTIALFGHKKLNEKMSLKETLSMLNDLRMLNTGELIEKAVAKQAGTKQVRRGNPGYDLENKWEIKSANTAQQFRYGKPSGNRTATIGGLKNKTGTIRAVVTETLTNKDYYFVIPYSAYKDLTRVTAGGNTSPIKLFFDKDGTPRRAFSRSKAHRANMALARGGNGVVRPCYWDFEVTGDDRWEKFCSESEGLTKGANDV